MMKRFSLLSSFLFLIVCASIAQGDKKITLENIYKESVFRAESVMGFRSMKDGNFYSEINKSGELQKVRFSDGEVDRVLVNFKKLSMNGKNIEVLNYRFNDDESKLLLFSEQESIYRRSAVYKVFVYDLQSEKLIALRDQKVLHASFSPESDKVAYVFENNLYLFDIARGETVQITEDGSYNIINGNCDWVYEEEFEFTKAYEWSRDGDYLAFYRFDQSAVPEYSFAMHGALYPKAYKYKYPKAGEPNSKVSIHLYHIQKDRIIDCDLGDEKDIYIPRIKINPFNNTLVVYKMNRLQNQLELLEVNPLKGQSDVIFEEKNKYFVEIDDNIHFFNERNGFVFKSERDGYAHLYVYDIPNRRASAITKGSWEVSELHGVDETSNMVYYTGTEASSMERNTYSIQMNGENKVNITPEKGWHAVEFSSGMSYFMDKYSVLNVPTRITIRNRKGELIRTLKDNESLKRKMNDYALGNIELLQVPNSEGALLNAWILKPLDFNPAKKYPLLMFQYSGPGSQQVTNQFGISDYWWYQMLAQKGYIIACVDGRGTGFRGEEFKKKTYLQLGKYESEDQISAAIYFSGQPWIDASRIGIWGWSYGGFMSSTCLMKGPEVFKMAIAVAPVTNWRYYDNIYTERYMRTPQENAAGYDDNSPVNMVKDLKGNFLLIHGTADDNVHDQNSLMLIDAMIKADKEFDAEFYPNKNHSIAGAGTRLHLYRRLTNFILEKL